MSDSNQAAPKRRVSVKRVTTKRGTTVETADFVSFLAELGQPSTPKLHVNGAGFPACVVTVDFGQPLVRAPKLTNEQSAEFVNRLRKLTRDVLGRDANVRVSHDGQTGIYWTVAG